jgi:Rps23 Pro-64 3,4-dihydroxylase Tpa1-like proline 4-hydroxylase
VIYYLTKDWTEANGGVLIDIPTGTRYVPEFNSLVAFRIPRFHEVTAVTAGMISLFVSHARTHTL